MLCFLAALGGARFFRAATAVFLGLLALFFGIHAVYHDIFSEYLSVGMLGVAGGALTGYWREALRGIVRCLPEILLMLAPFVLWLVFGKRLAPEGLRGRRKLLPLLLFLALQLAASAGVRLCTGGVVPLSLSYGEGFVMDTGVASFGLLTAQRIDAAQALEDAARLREARESAAPAPEPMPTPLPTPTPASTPTPEVFTPEPQVLDIDFEALMANEWDSDILAVHEFVSGAGAELDERVHGHVPARTSSGSAPRASRPGHWTRCTRPRCTLWHIRASSLKTSTAPSPPPRRRAASS